MWNPALVVGDAGAYVAWTASDRVYVLRLDGDGSPASGWPATGLPVDAADYLGGEFGIAPDEGTGCFIAWNTVQPPLSPYDGIKIQHFTPSGPDTSSTSTGPPTPTSGERRVPEVSVLPNPSRAGAMSLAYSLPDGVLGDLEIYDVAGRAVVRRSLRGCGRLDAPSALQDSRGTRSGLYIVRLTASGHSATAKWLRLEN